MSAPPGHPQHPGPQPFVQQQGAYPQQGMQQPMHPQQGMAPQPGMPQQMYPHQGMHPQGMYPQQMYPHPGMYGQPAKPAGSPMAAIFAAIAILMGLYAFLVAGMRGHGAGWEEMLIYCIPSWIGGTIAIAMRRNALSFIGVFFSLLAVLSFFLGA